MTWQTAPRAWHDTPAAGTEMLYILAIGPLLCYSLCTINIDRLHKQPDEPCIWGTANSIWIILHKSENVIAFDIPISIISERDDHNWVTLNLVYWTAVRCLLYCDYDLCNESGNTKKKKILSVGTFPGQQPKYLLLFVQLMAILILFFPLVNSR